MCVVSMIIDARYDEWGRRRRRFSDTIPATPSNPPAPPPITQDEVDEFRRLLERAREYDKQNNEPDCEMVEKKEKLKALAKELGIDIAFVDEVTNIDPR